jgi:hypothetical protein
VSKLLQAEQSVETISYIRIGREGDCATLEINSVARGWKGMRGGEQVGAPEDGGDTTLRNVISHKKYTAPHPRKWHSSWLQP